MQAPVATRDRRDVLIGGYSLGWNRWRGAAFGALLPLHGLRMAAG